MDSVFRRFMPNKPSSPNVDDEYSVEYSFAMEYSGPPVGYDIPQVVPVDVKSLPMAAEVPTSSTSSKLSLPVIQPIVKKNQNFSKETKSGAEAANSPISVIQSGEFDDVHVVRLSSTRGTSFRVVNVIDSSGELGCSDNYQIIRRRVLNGNGNGNENGSSGNSPEDSHGLSVNSEVEGVVDGREGGGVSWDLRKPGFKSPGYSTEITSSEEEESVHEARLPRHRTQIVTFRDPELSDIVHGKNDDDAQNMVQERRRASSNVKKGLCHRCLKGNRFMEKETCLVCGAKYCFGCVLRAMGSMPEGRKCISCIGCRIDESKRATLGRCSGMLKRFLTDVRAKEIMGYEVSCEANQIPPELVFVNGKPLCHEEMVELLSCLSPPRMLKPGKYWYDKVSGLWGKEGKKPSQVISSHLAVGDPIMSNASNGNTNILVNNREITKQERWLLQLAGINCQGNLHLWMSANGSLQEEGQKNVMKRILFKPRVKLVSALLSLPIPSESVNSGAEEVDKVAKKVVQSNLDPKTPHKLLMVGSDKSGTSTILKQARILYNVPFSEEERQNIKFMIQSKLYGYLAILLEERQQFEEECLSAMNSINQTSPSDGTENNNQTGKTNIYCISPRLKAFSDWLLQVMMSGNLEVMFPAATREYAPLVEELWKDRAIQATYNRRNELPTLPRVENYFLDRAVEISRTEYEPSDLDILYAEGLTSSNGIVSVEFSFPTSVQDSFMDPADHNDPSERYQLIRVPTSSLGENFKWLEMLEDVDLVIYCIDITDYDQFSYDMNGVATNKMMESKKLFETIVNHPVCAQKDFLLALTKFDILEEKIKQVPLNQCEWFDDFNPVISSHSSSTTNNPNASLAQRAFHYIAAKFKGEFYSLTGKRLYVSRISGLESDSVDEALKYAREVLKWEDYDKPNFTVNEWSSGSVEASTSS